jgi:hypothetical protein
MNMIETHCSYKFNSIVLSKLLLKRLFDLPKIIKLSFFFYVHIKKYKKNLLLFYIVISLFFGNLLIMKKKEIQKLYIFNVVLKKNKIFVFFLNFVNVYLPLINITENILKCGILFSKNKMYRLNYLNFPSITELEVLYVAYEPLHLHVGEFKFQLDIYFYVGFYIKNLLDFLLRLYRFPCVFQYKKRLC